MTIPISQRDGLSTCMLVGVILSQEWKQTNYSLGAADDRWQRGGSECTEFLPTSTSGA